MTFESNQSELHKKLGPEANLIDHFADVANKAADVAGEVIRKYFRKKIEVHSKDDMSPVTIADQAAEEAMVSIILEHCPDHAVYGEEHGWQCQKDSADYVWILDPIDGTMSFITGKPQFGTLIALVYKGKTILGVMDQPILKERWVGVYGRTTKLNGEAISTRCCGKLSDAYLYSTSPHYFKEDGLEAFARVRDRVKAPLYGGDCYAYALLATGFADLIIESCLDPYDFLALIPIIEGAGGVMTNWKGEELHWEASPDSQTKGFFSVVAAGDRQLHHQVLEYLQCP